MYFLGVDGGQSSTQAVIGNEKGNVVGRGSAGPCNHVAATEGEAKLRRVIGEVVRSACAEAGISSETAFRAACFGMSGGPDDKRRIIGEVIDSEDIAVVTDAEIALAGATGGKPGIVVIAGTGSIAYGKAANGLTARVGGWGYVFGDEGSAFGIVREALRGALAAEEGWGDDTVLVETFKTATSSESVNEVMHKFYTDDWPRDRVARLAPTVDDLASGGDGPARHAMRHAARQLGNLAIRANSVLEAADQFVKDVYTIGGVFQSPIVASCFSECVLELELEDRRPRHDPAVGALLLAYKAAGLRVEIA